MNDYDLDKVNDFKKILINNENYWDEDLSVEFCIAIRTRDIFLGRKIVDDFEQARNNANRNLIFDYQQEEVWQEYFRTYVTNVRQIADFWSIFILPTNEFAQKYSELDQDLYPKLSEITDEEINLQDIEPALRDLLNLFKEFKNYNYWNDDKHWEWFFFQYLKYLTNKIPVQECRDGLGFFISTITRMQSSVETSGWKIDYRLHENPLEVWGGQSSASKFNAKKQAKSFIKRLKTKDVYSLKKSKSYDNPYNEMGFWGFAILSTLMIVFFPWSLLFSALFLGLSETKLLILALINDAIKTLLGIISIIIILSIPVILLIIIFVN